MDISAFVCDAPARSFLKCIKPFNSYYGCERCIIKGRWENRDVFSSDRLHALRTDESFNNFEYKEHQTRLSPLVEVGVSCVNGFPLDYMHLVCLGVVKRILMFYKQGPRECRLSQQQLSILSNNLVRLKGKMQENLLDSHGLYTFWISGKQLNLDSFCCTLDHWF